jgi:hypothetical protein
VDFSTESAKITLAPGSALIPSACITSIDCVAEGDPSDEFIDVVGRDLLVISVGSAVGLWHLPRNLPDIPYPREVGCEAGEGY